MLRREEYIRKKDIYLEENDIYIEEKDRNRREGKI